MDGDKTLAKSIGEQLVDIFYEIKLNFANIYIHCDAGSGSTFEFEVNPKNYLKFAKKDIDSNDVRGRINAITNAKRAIDCQTDKILSIFKIDIDRALPQAASEFIKLVNHKQNTGEKHNLKFIEALGIAPISLISKVRRLRHGLEHFYKSPSKEEADEAIELAELYINATENKIGSLWDLIISSSEDDKAQIESFWSWYQEDEGAFKLHFFNKGRTNIFIKNTDIEFYFFLKICIFFDDEDEISSCLSGLLKQINHPQSVLKKINVICS